jgi:hypothetical protein
MSDGQAHAKRVEKEELKDFDPAKKAQNLSPAVRKQQVENLKKAMVLGNSYKSKCTLVIEDSEGLKNVETTIWMADELHIVLKGGIVIPISSIRDVLI